MTKKMNGAGEDPILLEVYKSLLTAAAEEMGAALQQSAFSPNIKERRDFSCALFDADGRMTAQAAHIPVHLGAMPLSVRACMDAHAFEPGDAVLLNDPYEGGTHLPDITLVTPVFLPGETRPFAFAASRAHHADVGGMSPGSMPLSREIYQEGLIIPPIKIMERGKRSEGLWKLLLANTRTPNEREGDLNAQFAANHIGAERLKAIVKRRGKQETADYMDGLLRYSERMTRALIADLPDGVYEYEDHMDGDGVDPEPVRIAVSIAVKGGEAAADFSGSPPQRIGNVNAVEAIAVSAAHYAFLSLLAPNMPVNAGSCAPIAVNAPIGTVVNARRPAAVAAGNVETSQRIVDALLGALAKALPTQTPAASQGSMNNLTVGGIDPRTGKPYAYYETIGGGAGAGPASPGVDAVHTHMTNTMNTPVEALEYAYPFRVIEYSVRVGSGGEGQYRGGNGVVREIELLADASATLLAESRKRAPYGLNGGQPGKPGEDDLIRGGKKTRIPGKTQLALKKGDRLRIETPGGGGYGPKAETGSA